MASFQLTDDAQEDLIGIWLYTFETWGEAQADDYQTRIHDCCQNLADGKTRTKTIAGIANVNVGRCEHHFIFFTPSPDGMIVLAVLHERMDMIKRLRDRF